MEHEQHLDCPSTDPTHFGQARDDLGIAQLFERRAVRDDTFDCLGCQVPERRDLGAGEAHRAQRCFGCGNHHLRCWKRSAPDVGDEASENIARGGCVQLLVSNGLRERLEWLGLILQYESIGADSANQASEVPVDAGQVVENVLAHTPFTSDTSDSNRSSAAPASVDAQACHICGTAASRARKRRAFAGNSPGGHRHRRSHAAWCLQHE